MTDPHSHACPRCGAAVAARALFCHHCGALQPPGEGDAYARLNLEPRFDIDMQGLERQKAGFLRLVSAERLAGRDAAEQALGAAHRRAIADAYALLRDPVTRARHLLDLRRDRPGNEGGPVRPASPKGPDDADVHAVHAELDAARDVGDFDDIDGVLIGYIAAGVLDLAQAFALNDLDAVPRLADRLAVWQMLAARAAAMRGTAPA